MTRYLVFVVAALMGAAALVVRSALLLIDDLRHLDPIPRSEFDSTLLIGLSVLLVTVSVPLWFKAYFTRSRGVASRMALGIPLYLVIGSSGGTWLTMTEAHTYHALREARANRLCDQVVATGLTDSQRALCVRDALLCLDRGNVTTAGESVSGQSCLRARRAAR